MRDFLAIMVLVVLAAIVGWIIVQNQRLRVPVLEENPFALKAQFSTAQAVVPGQGQTVRVAGVRIGDVAKVELDEGRGVVTMAIDRKFLPVYRNATVLLRPKTGLKDMFLEMDPGDRSAGEFKDGDTLPQRNTAPDINLDEVLTALDTDTREYLVLLIGGLGKGLDGRDKDLGEVLKRLGPLNRLGARLSTRVAERRRELKRLIHNFNTLTREIGRKEGELTELVDASNAVFEAFGSEDTNISRAVALLPGTLRETKETLIKVDSFARKLGPTMEKLRPFARNLDDANDSIRPFSKAATPIVRDEIRPFVRAARQPVADLQPAARELASATPDQEVAFEKLNRLFNMAAYNPKGAEAPGAAGRDEGYLYWLAWLNHLSTYTFTNHDAHGAMRKVYLALTCATVRETINNDPASSVVQNLAPLLANPTLCGT